MDSCVFCKIIKGEIPSYKIYEDDQVISFLDAFPVTNGHVLVVPKHHCQILTELPNTYYEIVMKTISNNSFIKDVTGANLVQNNGKDSGQVVPHVHFHIIPRKPSDNLIKLPDSAKDMIKPDAASSLVSKIKMNL